MKKLISILGIGVISTAVALAPAFAQQTKPLDQAGPAAVQTSGGVTKDKAVPAKTVSDAKTEAVAAKPGADIKTGSAPMKTETGVKEPKGANVKPEPNLKNGTTVKSDSNTKAVKAHKKHHAGKSAGKPDSMMHAKTHAPNPDTRKATEKSADAVPSPEK